MLDYPAFFSGDMEGFVSLEVMEDYNLEELKGIDVGGPSRKKKAKVESQEVNLDINPAYHIERNRTNFPSNSIERKNSMQFGHRTKSNTKNAQTKSN